MSDNWGGPQSPDQGGGGSGYPPYPGQSPGGGPAYPQGQEYPQQGQAYPPNPGYPPGPGYGYPPGGQGYPPPGYGPYGGGGQPRNGLGVAALVLGIAAIVLSWTVVGGILLGIGALVCGFLGRGRVRRQEANNGGLALAGIITGAIGAAIALVILIAAIAFFVSEEGRTYLTCLDDAGNNQAAIDQCTREFERS
ncbi:protein of unknown function (DUF4190) [Frankia sp. EI5c]|uniref:DUF4190 domain-containing protein n=1 Tax=Frankia sp. EI5c TaxID=683316 RepID=UPI0007C27C8B|nr:DUF4190 domain-containing protein [Frankia sp. EI5c]OAA29566.1 protein of unknown function (DUF4190) [Frankia sp. EI5c]